ncbi:hypothetical protein HIM_06318 [Hirsutella minnesotensis 3608]|uniref:GH16 domain-containing protein n=1 Tax=Hirsutella minnesotensis 3608 TaxID=1043627 RepID=A0A0F7ZZJ1_9HYPO|nr:hypothetical protein HIM_06318 [Hirsutella minnesotensis 3608]
MYIPSSWLVLLAALGSAGEVAAAVNTPPGYPKIRLPYGFARTLFFDDFSDTWGGYLPSPEKWTVDVGTSYPGGHENWGTGEVQAYTRDRSNIRVTERQTLQITPIRVAHGAWTSARIETTPNWDFGCSPGRRLRIEARIRLGNDPVSKQLGIWPAFWALGSAYRGNYWNWPDIGEIDILESVNGESKVRRVAHCGAEPGGACNEPSGLANIADFVPRGAWHTFAWEVDRRFARPGWGRESMSWYVDGDRRWSLSEADVNNSTAWRALVENRKMILLNVAVGGSLPDVVAGVKTPTEQTLGGPGASMEIDYVGAWEG